MTFEQLLTNHANMLTDLFGEPASTNPADLVGQLEAVAHVYAATSFTTDAADVLTGAATSLSRALEEPSRKAQLIRRADKYLDAIDAMALA